MNAVSIDVSKGKSTVAILRPGGEVVASPFEVSHNPRELNGLVTLIKSLDGDTKIVMEYTGSYYLPVVYSRGLAQFFISDVMDEDIICPMGEEYQKLLLADDFGCWNEGEYIGQVSRETIAKMPKAN